MAQKVWRGSILTTCLGTETTYRRRPPGSVRNYGPYTPRDPHRNSAEWERLRAPSLVRYRPQRGLQGPCSPYRPPVLIRKLQGVVPSLWLEQLQHSYVHFISPPPPVWHVTSVGCRNAGGKGPKPAVC